MQDIKDKINKLKKDKDAIILAHYYQTDEIQKIADFVGDSLELSKIARDSKEKLIFFCGVNFMAGSAKLLAPEKKVLIPVKNAYCPMAEMITSEDVRKMKKKHPNAEVVAYINSSVDVKTETDICCTSSNAIKVVNSVDADEIIFIPDRNLGSYVSRYTDKKVILYEGYCPTHDQYTEKEIAYTKKLYPNALVLTHPECKKEVVKQSDFCGSTSKIIDYVKNSNHQEFIIGTEQGILYKLKEKFPDKTFYMLGKDFICKDMKKISLENLYNSLLYEQYEIDFEKEVIKKASVCLNRMMSL